MFLRKCILKPTYISDDSQCIVLSEQTDASVVLVTCILEANVSKLDQFTGYLDQISPLLPSDPQVT